MKKLYLFLIMLVIMLSCSVVNANTINSIKMDIYVDNGGDAHIKEVWECYVNEGTESYHPYYNLGNSEIVNLSVEDEDDVNYSDIGTWNVNSSFDGKKYKSGINKISNGVELCWGISDYGSKVYNVSYTITNFVSELQDSQMIYWALIPYDFSNTIGNAYIKIHSDFRYASTIDVWGYGNYGGTAYVHDGYIEMQSKESLDKNEYMTILVKFPSGTFNVTNKINSDFNYYLNMAEKGVTKYQEENGEEAIIEIMIYIFVFAVIIIGTAITNTNYYVRLVSTKSQYLKDIKEYKEYYRDIPCKGNIFRAFYIAYEYRILNKKSDLFGAMLLNWMRKGTVKIEKREVGRFRKREETCLILPRNEKFENKNEQSLYDMMYSASGDGILESKELEKWCSSKYNMLFNWFEKVIDSERKELVEEGILKAKSKYFKKYEIVNEDALYNEALRLKGLKSYLKDYTLISEREPIEVSLFESYLVYAQIFGIAKAVMKAFKDLYPEIVDASNYDSYDNIDFIYTSSYRGIKNASEAKSRADSYSSGGGGGGSFGGGGRRRRIQMMARG